MPKYDVTGEWGAGALTITAIVDASNEAEAELRFRERFEATDSDRLWVRVRDSTPMSASSFDSATEQRAQDDGAAKT